MYELPKTLRIGIHKTSKNRNMTLPCGVNVSRYISTYDPLQLQVNIIVLGRSSYPCCVTISNNLQEENRNLI